MQNVGKTKLKNKVDFKASPHPLLKEIKKPLEAVWGTISLKEGAVGLGQQTKKMKQEGEMFVVACRPMAGVSPVSANSQSQQPFPTPSPFSFSDAPARLSTRPPIYLSNLILRFLALVFSFVSALSLAASSSKKDSPRPSSFADYSELL